MGKNAEEETEMPPGE